MAVTTTVRGEMVLAGITFTAHKQYTDEAQLTVPALAVAIDATNAEYAVSIPFGEIIAIGIFCDQDVTIKTNDGDTPDDTIELKADVPLIWTADSYFEKPLTEDVSSIFVTNDGDAAATLKIAVLMNSAD